NTHVSTNPAMKPRIEKSIVVLEEVTSAVSLSKRCAELADNATSNTRVRRLPVPHRGSASMSSKDADLILVNGRIATQDERRSMVQALAIKDGQILATGSDAETSLHQGSTIALNVRTLIPG